MELDREYSSETQNSRVRRRTIGKVVPLFADRMYPNENYFALVPNTVPREIRDPFSDALREEEGNSRAEKGSRRDAAAGFQWSSVP